MPPALARRLLALLTFAVLVDARGELAPSAAHGQTFPWPPGSAVEDGPPPGWGVPYMPGGYGPLPPGWPVPPGMTVLIPLLGAPPRLPAAPYMPAGPAGGVRSRSPVGGTIRAASACDQLTSDITPKSGRGTPPGGATGAGPWQTRVLLATSADGLTFTRTNQIVSDQAGVPNALLDRDGCARVYYIDWGNGNIIAMAMRRGSGGFTYRRVSVTGLPTGTDPVDPTVVLLSDGRYRLYYMQGTPTPSIYSAISDDGITFARESGTRFAPGEAVYDPTALQTTAGWRLWTGPDGRFTGTSSDGLTFTSTGEFRVGGQTFMTWSAIAVPGRGYRVYGNFVAGGGLTSAFSTDGASWTAEPGQRLTSQGADPNLESGVAPDNGAAVLADGSYLLAYLTSIPANAPTPGTATPVVAATATPTVTTVACTPRPNVGVATAVAGSGRLQVTVSAQGAGNALQALRFGAATNALVDVPGGQTGATGHVTLPAGTTQSTFFVRQAAAGQAVTAPLTVVDGCGDWPTFVGAGANAL